MFTTLLALIAAALFAGAALYVSLAEHPARMSLADSAALAQWKPSHARAMPILAVLALASLLLGLWAWWKISDEWVLAGALLAGASLLTLVAILPVSRRLQAAAVDSAGADTRLLLARWGRLHALRTLLGLAAVATYFAAFLQP